MNQFHAPATINPATAKLPAAYEGAKNALSHCVQIDECKDWADKAQALASYAKQANDDELMKMATRIRDRAIRRAGELLKQIEPASGTRTDLQPSAAGDTRLTRKHVAEEAGMSPRQMHTALRVANVPREDFERQVESDKPPTVSQLAQQGIKRPAPRPIVNLEGRDPGAFNRALHFIAEIEDYAKAIGRVDLDTMLPSLIESEAARVRKSIAAIDAIHDRIVTRI
jgi:AraC-like DNA-binding protein